MGIACSSVTGHAFHKMAEIISIGSIASARRRAREREATEACVVILEANLQLALQVFHAAP